MRASGAGLTLAMIESCVFDLVGHESLIQWDMSHTSNSVGIEECRLHVR